MNNDERQLIDGLFSRLKQAAQQSPVRDEEAEKVINSHLSEQGNAGYYMAQVLLVQEEALKRMEQQVKGLEEQNRQLNQQLAQASARSQSAGSQGGFLSSLFGLGGQSQSRPNDASWGQQNNAAPQANQWGRPVGAAPAQANAYQPQASQGYAPNPAFQQAQAAPAANAGRGFLGGALQTAAGVAGGVLLAESISSLFSHHSGLGGLAGGAAPTEEIVNIYNEAPGTTTTGLDSGGEYQNGWTDTSYNQGGNDWGSGLSDNNQADFGGYDDGDMGGFDDDDFV